MSPKAPRPRPGSWTRQGQVITRDLSNAILPGVTRRVILEAAAEAQLRIVERPFTLAEAKPAREAFITAATLGATPVIAIDGEPVGRGPAGPGYPTDSGALRGPGGAAGRRRRQRPE